MAKNLSVTIKLPPVEAGVTKRMLRVGSLNTPAGKTFAMGSEDLEIELVLCKGGTYTVDLQDGNAAGWSPWSPPLVFSTPADVTPVPVVDPNAAPVVPALQPPSQPSAPTVDLSTATETDDAADVE